MLRREMMNTKFLLILIILLIASIVFPFMIIKSHNVPEIYTSIIQTLVLFWTAVILIWYTVETSRLRKVAQKQVEVAQNQVRETQRQTEVQQRPFVIVQDIKDNRIRIRNIGTSSAINIKLWGVRKGDKDQNLAYFSLHSINSMPYIAHTNIDPTPVRADISKTNRQNSDRLMTSKDCIFIFKILYNNVEMLTYYTEQIIKSKLKEPMFEMGIDSIQPCMHLEIYKSGKFRDREGEDLIWINPFEDGNQPKVCLTQTGKKRLDELEDNL